MHGVLIFFSSILSSICFVLFFLIRLRKKRKQNWEPSAYVYSKLLLTLMMNENIFSYKSLFAHRCNVNKLWKGFKHFAKQNKKNSNLIEFVSYCDVLFVFSFCLTTKFQGTTKHLGPFLPTTSSNEKIKIKNVLGFKQVLWALCHSLSFSLLK